MGCQTSALGAAPNKYAYNKEDKRTNLPVISSNDTLDLQYVMQQPFLRWSLRDFTVNHTKYALSQSSKSLAHTKIISMNCIDFWTDVLDFAMIKQSSFQRYRACHIFEKYIMHGASQKVSPEALYFI